MSRRVVVAGAGIVGACCALALQRDGHPVVLVDAGEPGGEQAASYGNGAWLSPASVVPMSLPGTWRKVPGWLLDAEGPLTLRWRALPALAPWLWRFLRAGARVARVEASARALSALLRDAPERHAALAAQAGVSDLVVKAGLVYAYPERVAFEAEALAWRLRRDNGVVWDELDARALAERLPALGPSYRFGVRVAAGAHCLDPGAYVAALARLVVARGGELVRARVRGFDAPGGRLRAVRTEHGVLDCDAAVIAAGIGSASLARAAGDAVPLASERGYHVVVAAPGFTLASPVMPSDGKMANTSTRAGLRLAGQVELAAVDAPPDWRRADILLAHARRAYPALAALPARSEGMPRWLGHRPSTPDGLPVIGPAHGIAGIVHAFGHGHVGLAAAPATADLVAELVGGRASGIDPAPYAAARFRR